MEHFYTYDRVVEAPAGAFNKYEYEKHRIGPCRSEAEAWEILEGKIYDTSDCRLIAVDDGRQDQ